MIFPPVLTFWCILGERLDYDLYLTLVKSVLFSGM